MSIKKKILYFFLGTSLVLFLSILTVTFFTVKKNLIQQAKNDLNHVKQAIFELTKTGYDSIQNEVKDHLRFADYLLQNKVRLSNTQKSWQAVNQITKESTSIDLPILQVGDKLLTDNILVDQLTKLIEGSVTIFQAMPQGLLRVSTSITTPEGNRATGTYIPTDSPVYQTVMKGETFYGKAFVVKTWYVTAYKPLYQGENIIGAIYVGVSQDTMIEKIKETLQKFRFGKSGYPFIMDTKGLLIIHPVSQGKNIYESKDSNGRFFIKEMIEKRNGEILYPWKNSGESLRDKLAVFTYIPEMDWIVAISAYTDEYNAPVFQVALFMLIIMLVGLLLIILTANWLGNDIRKAIQKFSLIFSKGSQGDLTAHYPLPSVNCKDIRHCNKPECPLFDKDSNQMLCYKEVGSHAPDYNKKIQCPTILSGKLKSCEECQVYKIITRNEINALGADYNFFIRSLSQKIKDLKTRMSNILSHAQDLASNAHQAASSVEEISATVKTVSGNIDNQKNMLSDSTSRIEKIISGVLILSEKTESNKKEIADASSAIEQMTASIASSASLAGKEDQTVKKMEKVSIDVNDAMKRLFTSIEGVSKNSDRIVEMVQLIMDISEQTNLLAMNAAIEAAHAGEYGKGFAVVAEEIRKLADKSAQGAKQIQSVVQDTSNNLQENKVIAENTKTSFDSLRENIDLVYQISQDISAAMEEQKSANQTILENISRLHESGIQTAAQSKEEASRGKEVQTSLIKLNTLSIEVATAMEEEEKALQEAADASVHVNSIANDLRVSALEIEEEFNMFKTN